MTRQLHARVHPLLSAGTLTALAAAVLAANHAGAADAPAEGELATVVVSAGAETATGPVEGYLATRAAGASKTDTPVAATPQAISVVTPDRMRDQGAQNVQDALRYVAGVRAEPYGLDSRGDWSLVRGTDPVIFQDGLQQSFGYYAGSRPDPFTLARIEVIKGPSSVLYGQGTPGGLVNLMSKRPQAEQQGVVELQAGSHERHQLGLDVTGSATADGSLLYRVTALTRESDTQVEQVPDDRRLLAPSLTWRPHEDVEWTLLAMSQTDDTGSSTQFLPHAGTVLPAPGGLPQIPVGLFMSEPGFDQYDTQQRSLTSLLDVRLNETWSLHQNLRVMESEVNYQTMYPAFPPLLQANGDINRVYWIARPELEYLAADQRAQASFGGGRLRQVVLFGVDYQHAVTNRRWAYGAATPLNVYDPVYNGFALPPAAAFVDDPENRVDQLGVYVQDQLELDGKWIFVAGLRSDGTKNKSAGTTAVGNDAVTTRAAVMYRTDAGVTPYLSWSESFQPLLGYDVYGRQYEPLRGEQVELGAKVQPAGSRSLASIAIFDLTEQNRATDVVVGGVLGQVQTGEARAQGVELEAVLAIGDNTDLIANYAWTDTEVSDTNPAYDGKRIASVAEDVASLWAQQRFVLAGIAGLRAGAGVRYTGESQDGTDTLATPAVTLFDAMVGYDTGPWSLLLTGNNLEDETYFTTCLARGDCFVGTRRTVVGSVSYRF